MKLLSSLLIATLLALGASNAALAYSGEYFVTCNLDPYDDNFLALRACGSTRCPEIARLGPDTFMISTEPYGERGWREVIVLRNLQDQSYSGPRGWVYSKYICPVRH